MGFLFFMRTDFSTSFGALYFFILFFFSMGEEDFDGGL